MKRIAIASAAAALIFTSFAFLPASGESAAATQETAKHDFKDGQAQVVEAFNNKGEWIRHYLWVETEFDSDGDGMLDRMFVDVTRPKQTDTEGLKVPVVYGTSPYFWGTSGTHQFRFFWDLEHEVGAKPPKRPNPPEIKRPKFRDYNSKGYVGMFVPRGYAVVHSASPGTGYSQGCPTIGGENESLAPKAVIDWLNGRAKGFTTADGKKEVVADWCTGKVGMIGTSFNGTLPLAAATTGVEGLEAIIPVSPNTSYYHYYRSNGLVRSPGGYPGEDIDVLYDFVHSGDPKRRDWCNKNVRKAILNANLDRESGDSNEFWEGRDYVKKLGGVKAAVLIAHGFNDWNVMPEHSVRVYEALRDQGSTVMCYFHQGGHGGDPTPRLIHRWFTRYLHGVENGVEKDARAWIVREGENPANPTPYAEYPHPKAEPVVLYPNGDGDETGTLEFVRCKGEYTLADQPATTGGEHAMAKSSKGRLLFATQELVQPVHISGHYELTIRVASNRPAANLSVWLVSLPWLDGATHNENLISRGWADPQNRESNDKSQKLKRGEFVDLTFELEPDDQIIPVGERIGLMIFATDSEFTLQPKKGTKLTVDLAGTSISLPVVGGEAALESALGGK